ncbi:DUF806 family protein [Oenococcus oeni]|uniref:DUF806 family protein n=1 Tax=Oenococcus oeni TaxID=1247 RepID=UPI0010B6FC65|nr:DUF806 family protein [Oenococcus oeni]SYW19480.1 conserved hypothetical protein [Oenococcus oeni]
MRAVIEIKQIITDGAFSWIDNIYSDAIPENVLTDEDNAGNVVTDCLITETDNSPTTWGNNTFTEINEGVEIRLFYSLNLPSTFDMGASEIALMKLLLVNNWQINRTDAHYQDPDTGQTISSIYVSKLQTI